jgi:hypothetical protein
MWYIVSIHKYCGFPIAAISRKIDRLWLGVHSCPRHPQPLVCHIEPHARV